MTTLPTPDERWALFLDVDGTLIDIAEHPDSVQPSSRLGEILEQAADSVDGALALISGRPIAEIDRLTDHAAPAAAGLHGLERRWPGGREDAGDAAGAELAAARTRLNDLVETYPALYLEDKKATLALHYRNADDTAREAAERTVNDIVAGSDGALGLLAGKSVYEIKPDTGDKGDALRAFMAAPPFAGRRPVYVGDDVTDEAGFIAANAAGGISIRVGDIADSAADYQLHTVNEVLEWLEQIATMAPGPGHRAT